MVKLPGRPPISDVDYLIASVVVLKAQAQAGKRNGGRALGSHPTLGVVWSPARWRSAHKRGLEMLDEAEAAIMSGKASGIDLQGADVVLNKIWYLHDQAEAACSPDNPKTAIKTGQKRVQRMMTQTRRRTAIISSKLE